MELQPILAINILSTRVDQFLPEILNAKEKKNYSVILIELEQNCIPSLSKHSLSRFVSPNLVLIQKNLIKFIIGEHNLRGNSFHYT